jgi:uncharacterized repeat protein (TIGR03803 family)
MGTVFKVTTNGILTTIANSSYFAYPSALTLGNDGNFYGTTDEGGNTNSAYPNGMGTIFQVTTNGKLTTLFSFSFTNGADPRLALTLCNDGNFYGTTDGGGVTNSRYPNGMGTVFRLTLSPIITVPTLLASGQFQFTFDTATGVNYAVQYSTNLTQWFPLVILGGTGVPMTAIDSNAASSQQCFYRIVLSSQ